MKHEETCKHTAVVTNYFGDGYFCTDCDEQLTKDQLLRIELKNLSSLERIRIIQQELQSRFHSELYSKEHIKLLQKKFQILVYY